jgi:hypothetical protein
MSSPLTVARDLVIQHRRLSRQLAMHIARGVPADCLSDLYLRLFSLEAALSARGAELLSVPAVGES